MGSETPFRILVLGDFGARAHRGLAEPGPALGRRRLVRVDRDLCEKALATIAPELRLSCGAGVGDVVLAPRRLEDFHPEAIAARIPTIRSLVGLRTRLLDPRTFADAAEELRAVVDAGPKEGPPAEPPPPQGYSLEDVFGATESRPKAPEDEWAALVRELVGPEIEKLRVPGARPEQAKFVAAVDAAIAERLRAVLHHPAFRDLEAAWRSVRMLVRGLETSPELTIDLLDVTKAEVADDVGVSGSFAASGLHRRLVEETVETPGAPQWALVVGLFTFDAVPRDVATLLRVAKLGHAAGAPFVAAGDGGIVGCRSLGTTPEPEEWTAPGDAAGRELFAALRRVPEASSVGLVWPRMLLRAPYGRETDEVEGFAFEEMTDGVRHDLLLWGNGAVAVALVLGDAFARAGADLRSEIDADVRGLPTVLREVDGEREIVPCAEAIVRTRGAERIAQAGMIPLLSVANEATVRVGSLRSVAADGSEIAGRWL
jgi:type VI secretion system protein ImpC